MFVVFFSPFVGHLLFNFACVPVYSSLYFTDVLFSLFVADFKAKFAAIQREYSPNPRKFYGFCTSVTVRLDHLIVSTFHFNCFN